MRPAGGRPARLGQLAVAVCGVILGLALVSAIAGAASGDSRANTAIDKAINEQYVVTDFDGAEKSLIEVVSKCGSSCSPAVVARAWMYVGLVRAMGKQDMTGAEEAFGLAVTVDPGVRFDEGLASPEVKKKFERIREDAGGSSAAVMDADGEEGDEDDGATQGSGEVFCAALPEEVEIGREIPIQCAAPAGARVELLYKDPGNDKWTKSKMSEVSGEPGTFRGDIPCKRTDRRGRIKWYVRSKQGGSVVGATGSKSSPSWIKLVKDTTLEPPSFPGSKPPARCDGADEDEGDEDDAAPAAAISKPKGTWGESCDSDDECQEGLLCMNGGCESPNSCETDDDCSEPGSYCDDGLCQHDVGGAFPRLNNWVGVSFGMDFMTIGGSEVCRPTVVDENDPDNPVPGSPDGDLFQCFLPDDADGSLQPYGPPNLPQGIDDRAGKIAPGIAPASYRFLLSYERLLPVGSTTFAVEARAGFVWIPDLPGGVPFIPLAAEIRAKYYFGTNPFRTQRFRPFITIGGGLGGASASLLTEVDDCNNADKDTRVDETGARVTDANGNPSRLDGDAFYRNDDLTDQPGIMEYEDSTPTDLCLAFPARTGDNPQRSLFPQAVLSAGPASVSGGVGAMLMFGDSHGVQLTVEGALLFPTVAFSLRPSLGYVIGF